MNLISANPNPADFFFEPIEYVFQRGEEEWAVSFVPTVPHGFEAERLYGDLFDCRLRDITYDSTPVPAGSQSEQCIIARLQKFADSDMTAEEQHSLQHGRFPSMTAEMVGRSFFLWFIGALRRRSSIDGI